MKTLDEIVYYFENIPKEKQELAVSSGRTVKDMVVHLAGWKLEATNCFVELCENGTKPWFYGQKNVSQFNEDLYYKYKNITYDEAIDLLKKSCKGRELLVEKYGKKKLQEVGLEWMFEDNVQSHANKHIEQINEALGLHK
jgi:hypothetical protein